MQITSTAFTDNSTIPDKYSYRSGNASPPLTFVEVPKEAISLALVCHDPDAPGKNGFTHWVLWNIDPFNNGFLENKLPPNVMIGLNDWHENNWGGPAPPSGTHRYIFSLYALDSMLEIPPSTNYEELKVIIEPRIIDTANLTGLYSTK